MDDGREAIRGDDQEAAGGFIGAAAPIDSADVAGENDGSFETGWREEALRIESFKARFAPGFFCRRDAPGVVVGEFLRGEDVVFRERLCGRGLFAWNFRLRYG